MNHKIRFEDNYKHDTYKNILYNNIWNFDKSCKKFPFNYVFFVDRLVQ